MPGLYVEQAKQGQHKEPEVANHQKALCLVVAIILTANAAVVLQHTKMANEEKLERSSGSITRR